MCLIVFGAASTAACSAGETENDSNGYDKADSHLPAGQMDGGVEEDAVSETSDANQEGEGLTGFAGLCEHSEDCGGTYYATVQDCIDATIEYWGECRCPELDAFGNCMLSVECDGWDPDAYDPEDTPCAAEWQAIVTKDC